MFLTKKFSPCHPLFNPQSPIKKPHLIAPKEIKIKIPKLIAKILWRAEIFNQTIHAYSHTQ